MNQQSVDGITITLIKENWIKTTYKDGCLLNASKLEEVRKIYTEMHGDEDLSTLRHLQIFEGLIEVSQDIAERYLTNRIRPKTGEAMVAIHPVTLQWVNGASAVMGRTHPVDVFETEQDAIDWLESL